MDMWTQPRSELREAVERQASDLCRQRVIEATEVVRRQVDVSEDTWQARLLRYGSVQPIKPDSPIASPTPKELCASERLKLTYTGSSLTSVGQCSRVPVRKPPKADPSLVQSPVQAAVVTPTVSLPLSPSAMAYIAARSSPIQEQEVPKPSVSPSAPEEYASPSPTLTEQVSPLLERIPASRELEAQELTDAGASPAEDQESTKGASPAPAQEQLTAEEVRAQLAQIRKAVLGASNPMHEPSPSRL